MPTRPPPLRRESACCSTALRKASRRLSQLYDDALQPSGLRSTQYALLAELQARAAQPPSLTELAEALVTDRSGLGHNLRPLLRDGLIRLAADAGDGRRRKVVLTARGKARLRSARRLWQQAQDRFLAIFGERPAARLRSTLLDLACDARLATLKDAPP